MWLSAETSGGVGSIPVWDDYIPCGDIEVPAGKRLFGIRLILLLLKDGNAKRKCKSVLFTL